MFTMRQPRMTSKLCVRVFFLTSLTEHRFMDLDDFKPRRKAKRKIRYLDDPELADVVSIQTVTTTTKSGKQRKQKIKVPLFPAPAQSAGPSGSASQFPIPSSDSFNFIADDINMSDAVPPPVSKPRKVRVPQIKDNLNK